MVYNIKEFKKPNLFGGDHLDITSPNSLWKDYDVNALPLKESALSQKVENSVTVREYYFDGYATVDGRVRAFIKIFEHPESKGVILYMPDKTGGYDDGIIPVLYGYGYTVAALDYLGKTDEYARYTLYPESLRICNSRGIDKFEVTEEAQYSRWFIWTCIARRATSLLKSLYDQKLFAVGVGLGGTTVYKLAAFDDGLSACATLLNIIPDVYGSDNPLIGYHAALDNSAYASISKIPLFMAISSNDEDGSLDDMSVLAENTESLGCFRIAERALSGGIKRVYPGIDNFFTTYDKTSIIRPIIKASNSENNLYFNISVDGASEQSKTGDTENDLNLQLFVAFCVDEAPFRNWLCIPAINLGGNSYMSHINVCRSDKHIYAFTNITDAYGNVQSSAVFSILPKTLGVKAKDGVSHRKLYDGSMGEDGWTTRNGDSVKIVNGPYDIPGITSSSKSIVTFKPGDPLFKVPADTLLQIMLNGKPQIVTVTVRDRSTSYSTMVEIKNPNDWDRFSLPHLSFKSASGPLLEWSQILMLELSFEDDFILGSVLWV